MTIRPKTIRRLLLLASVCGASAAIVGAAVGALHGEQALPAEWREGLLGRVVADIPDRRVFDLLDAAGRRFVQDRPTQAA